MARRLPVTLLAVLLALVATAAVASAHVVVSPGEAPRGATDVSVSFRVPNESDGAETVQVDVKLPTDHPLVGVLVEPVAGWTSTVKTTTLAAPIQTDDGPVTRAVSEITWKGGRIPVGDFQDFTIAVGRLPSDTGSLAFPTLQTYRDGKVVSWIEPAVEGTPEPEHPVPTLTLTAPATSTTGRGTSTVPPTSGVARPSTTVGVTAAVQAKDDDGATPLAVVALAVGSVALVASLVGLAMARGARRRSA